MQGRQRRPGPPRHQPRNYDNRLFSERYWWSVFLRTLLCVGAFAITAIVIGVLAIPIVLSMMYAWLWMLLYPVYLIVILLVWAILRKERYYEDY